MLYLIFGAGLLIGILLASVFYIVLALLKTPLKNQMSRPIIGDSFIKPKSQKRTPKALTDLMAYNKEISEQGENRG